VDDNFFELGGHSLLAVRMMRDVEEIYGRSVPLATLYASPTIETLAGELLRQERAAFASPFVVVQKGAGRTPLFFFHGDLNGGGFYCLKLARRLGADRPFFAVHPLGLDGRPAPPTVEAMAAAQLETILGVQPRGPYLLGGYCNGGLVAYEIARLLEARGERVEVLVLVAALADTGLRSVRALMRTLLPKLGVDRARCDRAFARLRFFRAAVARQPWWARAPFAIAKIARIGCEIVAPKLFHRESNIEASDALDQAEIDRERPLCSPATYHQYRLASMGYVPQRFGGRVLLFWPSEEPRGAWGDPTMGWGRVAGAVEVHHVACGHTEIVAQRADLIADRLKLHLDALDDRPSALREAV
jgi:thioesterase domain-containing protein